MASKINDRTSGLDSMSEQQKIKSKSEYNVVFKNGNTTKSLKNVSNSLQFDERYNILVNKCGEIIKSLIYEFHNDRVEQGNEFNSHIDTLSELCNGLNLVNSEAKKLNESKTQTAPTSSLALSFGMSREKSNAGRKNKIIVPQQNQNENTYVTDYTENILKHLKAPSEKQIEETEKTIKSNVLMLYKIPYSAQEAMLDIQIMARLENKNKNAFYNEIIAQAHNMIKGELVTSPISMFASREGLDRIKADNKLNVDYSDKKQLAPLKKTTIAIIKAYSEENGISPKLTLLEMVTGFINGLYVKNGKTPIFRQEDKWDN